jgi:ribonuclease HI
MQLNKTLIVYTDGASSGNPGPGWAMYVIGKLQKRIRMVHCTNNEAEYQAVVLALEELIVNPKLHQDYHQVIFKIDSNLVVQQLNGFFKVKDARMREFVAKVNLLVIELDKPVVFQYIPREKNRADSLKY